MTGQSISTSEIAKQLLESAREDRLEVVDLLAEPDAALRQIRLKGNAGQTLLRAEWTVVAHFAQTGMEAYVETTPNRVSRESMIAVLDAFLAVYELRQTGGSVHEPYYIGNLPPDCWPASARGRIERGDVPSPDIVRRTVIETRQRLNDPTWTQVPVFIGRNLLILLEDEKLPGVESIHRALLPYWPVLWRLAARGYYVATGEPIYERALRGPQYEPPIRPLGDGVLQLAFMRLEGGDLSVLISFPGAFGPMYPVSTYPKLTEFRAMLAALRPDGQRQWTGANFFGYVTGTGESPDSGVWFRGPDNGITVGLSLAHWTGLRALFQQAWELPELLGAWQRLIQDYGEL